MANLQAEWTAETKRLFDALVVEQQMVLQDTVALRERVMAGYVVDPPGPVDPPVEPPVDPPPVDNWIPPVIAISADQASVREG